MIGKTLMMVGAIGAFSIALVFFCVAFGRADTRDK